MKKGFQLLLLATVLFACSQGKKATLDAYYVSKDWKTYLESVYADSSDKKNLDILVKFINDVNNKTAANSMYATTEEDLLRRTYKEILENIAIPYDGYKKEEATYFEKSKAIMECKLVKINGSDFTYEVTNKGQTDITNILMDVIIKNKTGDVLYEANSQEIAQKVAKNSTKKIMLGMLSTERVQSLDMGVLDITINVTRIGLADGTTVTHPWQAATDNYGK